MDYLNPPERSLSEVSADEIVEACAKIASKWSILAGIELRKLKGTFSLRASGTALAGILKEGIQRMTDLMAEYAEAGELDRPFIRACDDWLTKARASLAAAPSLRASGAEAERERIIAILIDDGYLKGREVLPKSTYKSTHGNCCTCQECKFGYDDCVCEHNVLLQKIMATAPTLSEAGAPEGYTYECGCEFTGSLVKPCARHRAFFRGVLKPAALEAGAKEGEK